MDIKGLKDQARGLEQQGKVADALALYRQAIDQLDSSTLIIRELPLFVKVGDLCAKVGDTDGAIRHYEQAAEYYADDGATQSVVALCVKVLRVDVRRTIVYFRLARRMLDRGHVEPARAVLLDFAERSMQQKLLESLRAAAGRPVPEVQSILLRVIDVGERSFKVREDRRPAAGEASRRAPAPAAEPPAQATPSAPPPSTPKSPVAPAAAASPPSPPSPSAEPLVIQFGAEYLKPAAPDTTAGLHAPPVSIAPPPGSVSPTASPVGDVTPSVPTAVPPPALPPPPAPLPPSPAPPPPPVAVVPPAVEIPREAGLVVTDPVPVAPDAEVPAPAPTAEVPAPASSRPRPIAEQPSVPAPAKRSEPAVLIAAPTTAGPGLGRRVGIGAGVFVLAVIGFLVLKGRMAPQGTDTEAESEEPSVAVSEPLPQEGQPAGPLAQVEERPPAMSQDTVVAAQPEALTTPATPAPASAPEPAAAAGFVLTQPTVVIAGLPVENVVDVSPDAGGGYQVAQRLDSGDQVYVTVAPRGGPADTLLAGQIVVAPTDEGAVGQTVFSDYFVTIHGPVAVVVVESLLRRLMVVVPPE